MPVIEAAIPRAWRMRNETGRIHYIIRRLDGSDRRLFADDGSALYRVLDEYLQDIGYEGPGEQAPEAEESQPPRG